MALSLNPTFRKPRCFAKRRGESHVEKRPMSIIVKTLCGRLAVTVLLSAVCGAAQARIYKVGSAPACNAPTIQAAVDAARNHMGDGSDTIQVPADLTFTQQAIRIDEVENLVIEGGWRADCGGSLPGQSIVDGSGGAAAPVFSIKASAGVRVTLKNLAIINGDATGIGTNYGGGVFFAGEGVVHLADTWVVANKAAYGGGISAKGTGPNAKLILGSGTLIGTNEARYSGGGIYAESLELTMEGKVVVNGNVAVGESGAKGYGGGLKLVGNDYPANAYIRSTVDGTAVIQNNQARYGGGVAVETRQYNSDTRVRLYTTDPARPAIVQGNVAKVAGGGFYTEAGCGICWYTEVVAWDANILDNRAPKGAAAYLDWYDGTLDDNRGGIFRFNDPNVGRPPDSVRCGANVSCNRIGGNLSVDAGGAPTDGAIVHGTNESVIRIVGALLNGNRGRQVVYGNYIDLQNTLIVNNQTSAELVMADDYDEPPKLLVANSTLANNTIGAARMLYVGDGSGSRTDLARTILWQPGKTSLVQQGGSTTATHVLASELGSLGNGQTLSGEPPRFIDPENGNYRLQPGSWAVDYGPFVNGIDIDGKPRSVDLPLVFNKYGPTDLGPYERPALLPLLYNHRFDAGLETWKGGVEGATKWDASGSTSPGGAARIDWNLTGQSAAVFGKQQCVYLPEPGLYRLSGHGRTQAEAGQAEGDEVRLYWEFRRNGGKEACTAGVPTASGSVLLGNTVQWTGPMAPAYVNVPLSEFTIDSSIMVAMYVVDRGSGRAIGWFDDVALDLGEDYLFADGFEG